MSLEDCRDVVEDEGEIKEGGGQGRSLCTKTFRLTNAPDSESQSSPKTDHAHVRCVQPRSPCREI